MAGPVSVVNRVGPLLANVNVSLVPDYRSWNVCVIKATNFNVNFTVYLDTEDAGTLENSRFLQQSM